MFEGFRTARAVLRSLRIYYGNRQRKKSMDRLYGQFIHRGDLAFDIGAHVGDRAASFRRLSARVVAVEPQPRLARLLRLLFGRDAGMARVAALVGAAPGQAVLRLNTANPTVATADRKSVV